MNIKHTILCKLGKHEWKWEYLQDSCKQQRVCVHCKRVSETRQQPHVWGEWETIKGTLEQARTCKRCRTQERRPIPVQIRKDQEGFGILIEIPAGPFEMGSDRYKWEGHIGSQQEHNLKMESPRHEVSMPIYWIGKTPVTVAQFRSFVKTSGYQWANAAKKQGGRNHPVVYVNWYDAQAYCQWLTDTWRSRGFISAEEVVQIPSEAEWEKAARGIDGRKYPWGKKAMGYGHYSSLGPTKPVGSYSPKGDSPYGCVDMAGNVNEMTRSLVQKYPYDPSDGREDLDSTHPRVARGGNFRSDHNYVTTHTRCVQFFRNGSNDSQGFRIVVRTIEADE